MQRALGIVEIEMHIRDQMVLAHLIDQCRNQAQQISHDAIADWLGCHRHTAAAIVHRLELAGHVKIDRTGKRGGYVYSIPREDEARNRAG